MKRYEVIAANELKAKNYPPPEGYAHWEIWIDDNFHDGDADFYDVLYDHERHEVIYIDGGEPEDMLLCRDLRPLVDELNRVTQEYDKSIKDMRTRYEFETHDRRLG